MRFKQYNANIGLGGSVLPTESNPAAFGGGIGRAVQGVADVMRQKEIQDATDWANKSVSQSREEWTARSTEVDQNTEVGAPDVHDQEMAAFDKHVEASAANAPNGAAEKMYRDRMLKLRDAVSGTYVTMDARRRGLRQVQTTTDIIETSQNVLMVDPSQYKDLKEEVNKTIDDLKVSAEAKLKLREEASSGISKATAMGEISRDPYAAQDMLVKGRWDKELDPGDKAALLRSAAAAIKDNEEAIKKHQTATDKARLNAMAWEWANLMLEVKAGRAGEKEIEGWRQKYDDIKEAAGKWKQLKEGVVPTARVFGALAGQVFLTDSKDDKAAVGAVYGELMKQAEAENVPPQQRMDLAIEISSRLGQVPKQLKEELRGAMMGGTHVPSDTKILAANTLERLFNSNPQLRRSFSEDELSYSKQLMTYKRYGLTDAQAVQLANDSRNVSDAERTVRSRDFQEQLKAKDAASFLNEKIDEGWYEGAFGRNPVIPTQMQEEWTRLAAADYVRHNDIDSARAFAFDAIQRQWGVSKVAGESRFTRNAPELFFGTGGRSSVDDSKWINEQLVDDVTAGAAYGPDIADRLFLEPHPKKVGVNGLPVYTILTRDPDSGVLAAIMDENGLPRQWQPNYMESRQFKRDMKLRDAELQQAREKRAMRATGIPDVMFSEVAP